VACKSKIGTSANEYKTCIGCEHATNVSDTCSGRGLQSE